MFSAFVIYNSKFEEINQFVSGTLKVAIESCGWMYFPLDNIPRGTHKLEAGLEAISASQAVIIVENNLERYNAWLEQNAVLHVIDSNDLDSCSIISIVLTDGEGHIKEYSHIRSQLHYTNVWNKIYYYEGKSTLESLKSQLSLALSERADKLNEWKGGTCTSNENTNTGHSSKIKMEFHCTEEKPDTETTEPSEDYDNGQYNVLYEGKVISTSDRQSPDNAMQDDCASSHLQTGVEFGHTVDLHHFRPLEVMAGFLNSYTCAIIGLKLVIPLLFLVRLYLEYVDCSHHGLSICTVQSLSCFFLVIFVTYIIVSTTGQILARGHSSIKLDMSMIKQLGNYMVGELKLPYQHQCDPKIVISHCEKYLCNSFRDNMILIWSHSILLAIIFLQWSSHVNDMFWCKVIRVTISAIVMGLVRSCVVGYHYCVMLPIHVHRGKMMTKETWNSTALSQEVCWIKEKCCLWESFTRLFTTILISVTAAQITSVTRSSSVVCLTLSYWKPALLLVAVELAANCPCRSKNCIAVVADVIALLHYLCSTTDCLHPTPHPAIHDSCLELTEFHALVVVALLLISFPVVLSFNRSFVVMRLVNKHQTFLYIVVILLVLIVCQSM